MKTAKPNGRDYYYDSPSIDFVQRTDGLFKQSNTSTNKER